MPFVSLLNRRAELRQDSQRLSDYLCKDSTRILVSYKGQYVCRGGQPLYFDFKFLSGSLPDKIALEKHDSFEITYLGKGKIAHYFFLVLHQLPVDLNTLELLDLRAASIRCSVFDASLLFYAQGLSNWHFNHRYCAKCGHKSNPAQAGHSRICSNKACNKEHFPRIEPAVIVSIECIIDGTPKLLLARQANWPAKRYSLIAGFAEHGESLEHAVQREAMEEVGLSLHAIKYISSQPWPFPASLMLGFSAETNQQDICLVDEELEHAQWLSAKEMEVAVKQGDLLMPFSVSISWHLVNRWYKQQTGKSFKL